MTSSPLARLKKGSDLILFVALLSTVLVFGLLFLSQQESQDAQIAELVRTTTLPDSPPPPTPRPLPAPTPSATPTPSARASMVAPNTERDTFTQALEQCLSADPKFEVIRGSQDPAEVVANLDRARVIRNEREVENYRYRIADQSERRLQLIYEEFPDATPMVDAHLFSVSSDGIPIPTELPEELQDNPSPEAINDALREGQVFFHQIRRHLILDNDLYAEIESINDVPNEIVVRSENFSLVCIRRNCRCLQ